MVYAERLGTRRCLGFEHQNTAESDVAYTNYPMYPDADQINDTVASRTSGDLRETYIEVGPG